MIIEYIYWVWKALWPIICLLKAELRMNQSYGKGVLPKIIRWVLFACQTLGVLGVKLWHLPGQDSTWPRKLWITRAKLGGLIGKLYEWLKPQLTRIQWVVKLWIWINIQKKVKGGVSQQYLIYWPVSNLKISRLLDMFQNTKISE